MGRWVWQGRRMFGNALVAGWISFGVAVMLAGCGAADRNLTDYDLKTGDIVFQATGGEQCKAVSEATSSRFTHCGVVFEQGGKLMVIEAVQPVSITPLEAFIARSSPGTFHARRLKQAPDSAKIEHAREWAYLTVGKDYDLGFQWSDEKLYCSELVWKLYREAGVTLCDPRPFRDYALEGPRMTSVIQQRYGSLAELPLDEPAVAPSDLAKSPHLVEVPQR